MYPKTEKGCSRHSHEIGRRRENYHQPCFHGQTSLNDTMRKKEERKIWKMKEGKQRENRNEMEDAQATRRKMEEYGWTGTFTENMKTPSDGDIREWPVGKPTRHGKVVTLIDGMPKITKAMSTK